MSKLLETKNGDPFIVDDDDFERVSKIVWHSNGNGYIRGWIKKNSKREHILLHRFIMNPPDDKEIDHINHNPFDNRKSNLRIVDRATNAKNQKQTDKTIIKDGYVDIHKTMKILGYKDNNSIYKLIKQKRLTKYKVLGKSFFSVKEIEKLLTPLPEDSQSNNNLAPVVLSKDNGNNNQTKVR